jgi:hypothetical protein
MSLILLPRERVRVQCAARMIHLQGTQLIPKCTFLPTAALHASERPTSFVIRRGQCGR